MLCIVLYTIPLLFAWQIHATKQQILIEGVPLKSIENVAVQAVTSRSDFVQEISNIEGPFGSYRGMGFCPPNTWAVGFNQRVEGPQGRGDDTALNSVYLLCGDAQGRYVDNARSYDGLWGSWALTNICQGQLNFLRCFNIRVEGRQFLGDDTAANEVRMTCASGNELRAGNGGPYGSWGTNSCCPSGTAICGINVKFESSQGGGILNDDTAMNGARMACCTIPSFAPTKSPTTKNGRDDLVTIIYNWEAAWGNYDSEVALCPPESWAVGFSRKYHPRSGPEDDTALNGVSLACADLNTKIVANVETQEGPLGTWNSSNVCPGKNNFVECFQIKMETPQGPFADDTAANDVQMRCLRNEQITAPKAGPVGFWSSPVCCPSGTAVCGVDIKLQKPQGPGFVGDNDDTAMTGLRLACCSSPTFNKSPFDIEYIYLESTPPLEAAFENAAARWQRTILQDFPSTITVPAGKKCGTYVFPADRVVNDLLIIAQVASLEPIYGPGVLGVAGTCLTDQAGKIRLGFITIASEQLRDLVRFGQLNAVVVHEVGHQLGIGSLWADFGFVTSNFKYSGVQGSIESQVVGGPVPAKVEDQGGPGTKGKHWDEETYHTELMTGFTKGIQNLPLSRMTLGGLIDLGFDVEVDMADPYQVTGSASAAGGSLRASVNSPDKNTKPKFDIIEHHNPEVIQAIPKLGREEEFQDQIKKYEEEKKKPKKV